MKKALIKVGTYKIKIDFLNTHTAKVIYSKLPIVGNIIFWGNEVYFYTDLKIKVEEEARQIIEKGELAYWPQGDAIAIGYGPTPISKNQEIRLASSCNIWATTEFELEKLNSLKEQQEIIITHEKYL